MAPDLLVELVAGDVPTGARREVGEELALERGETPDGVAAHDLASIEIDDPVVDEQPPHPDELTDCG